MRSCILASLQLRVTVRDGDPGMLRLEDGLGEEQGVMGGDIIGHSLVAHHRFSVSYQRRSHLILSVIFQTGMMVLV